LISNSITTILYRSDVFHTFLRKFNIRELSMRSVYRVHKDVHFYVGEKL